MIIERNVAHQLKWIVYQSMVHIQLCLCFFTFCTITKFLFLIKHRHQRLIAIFSMFFNYNSVVKLKFNVRFLTFWKMKKILSTQNKHLFANNNMQIADSCRYKLNIQREITQIFQNKVPT